MIAGLLGEHLASPRTATKTNQNTALETKPAERGDSSSKEEFASMVQDDHQPAPRDAKADTKPDVKTAEDTLVVPATPGEVLDPAEVQYFESELGLSTRPSADTPTAPETEEPLRQGATKDIEATADPRLKGDALREQVRPQDTDINLGQTELDGLEEAASEARRTAQSAASIPGGDQPALETSDAELLKQKPTGDRVDAASVDANVKTAATSSTQLNATETPGLIRDTGGSAPEAVLTLGTVSTTGTSSAAPATGGLTPTAPAIPVASPSDLTSIVLNALKNGVDPQEQLTVQLDPPELGRVMIDFKFDAQGLQQVVVTTENPEALKRLREMHMELTEALKDQGLSDKNMSFRQESEGRSEQAWQSEIGQSRETSLIAADDSLAAAPAAPRSDQQTRVNDRLNLVL